MGRDGSYHCTLHNFHNFFKTPIILLQPNRYEVLPGGLSAITAGLARMEAGQVSRLKLVVHPQEV